MGYRKSWVVQEMKNAASAYSCGVFVLARTTGVEPATTGSTVRYSNQLSYVPIHGSLRFHHQIFSRHGEALQDVFAHFFLLALVWRSLH